ncbi:hypothetical protein FXO38_02124 [Capsicum annuum]|nr:hypothetical protein FXO37_04021 [Capsicum annuum]KAF3680739.1 hypothetical protein FXO38_02124 [Capsicum annuum]
MSMSSEEQIDISESEMEEYTDTWYQKLKEGYGKENISVSKASSRKVNDEGKHLGLTRYLNNDLLRKDSVTMSDEMEIELQPIYHGNDVAEKYAFPWIEIVANLPIEWKDGCYVGKSGSGLRDGVNVRIDVVVTE